MGWKQAPLRCHAHGRGHLVSKTSQGAAKETESRVGDGLGFFATADEHNLRAGLGLVAAALFATVFALKEHLLRVSAATPPDRAAVEAGPAAGQAVAPRKVWGIEVLIGIYSAIVAVEYTTGCASLLA